MQYPQFREVLLRIAADESRHADWIAEKINEIGFVAPGADDFLDEKK
jgi:rubrerythrin